MSWGRGFMVPSRKMGWRGRDGVPQRVEYACHACICLHMHAYVFIHDYMHLHVHIYICMNCICMQA